MKIKNKILMIAAAVVLAAAAAGITAGVENKKEEVLRASYTQELEKSQADGNALREQLLLLEEEQKKTAETYALELEKAQADGKALQEQLQLLEEDRKMNSEILIDLLKRTDYKNEPVYVIGHKSPDTDTVASAVGMAYLLSQLGITAEARITADVNPESDYALSCVGYDAPEVLEDASGRQLWLVDHSEGLQMVNGADEARIVGITDHHRIGDAESSEPVFVLSCRAGSTCSIVCRLCDLCDVELSKEIAGVLLAGVLSDTANLKSREATAADSAAAAELKAVSGISDTDALYFGMLEAKLSYKGMDDREIFYSDYKDYEHNGFRFGIGCIKVASADQIPAMADRMQKVIAAETENGNEADFLVYSIYDPEYSTGYLGYSGKDQAFTEEVMESAFGETGEKQDSRYVFKPSLSRKTEVVPSIDKSLDALR